MKKLTFILSVLFTLLLSSCINNENEGSAANDAKNGNQSPSKQLNINILLDLSDRLERKMQPSQKVRDVKIVETITEILKKDMKEKGAFLSKGKLRVLFKPAPNDPNVNNLAKKLNVDLSNMHNKKKKEVYDNIQTEFKAPLGEIYDLTMSSRNWIGSDIWRFFKNDLRDLCIEPDENYRNILVLVTDGYIFHEQSTDRVKNKTSFLTSKYLNQEGFHNNPQWRKKFEEKNYGLIPFDENFDDLEVLVLEINADEEHRNDEDIIRAYLGQWLNEMNVKDFEIHNTDLPENTKIRIENFFRK